MSANRLPAKPAVLNPFRDRLRQTLLFEGTNLCEAEWFAARVSVKNRRAEFPKTDDASVRMDNRGKASEVLKRSLKALTGDQHLATFLDHALVALTEQLGGLASSLWLLDGAKCHLRLHSICQGGRLVTAEESRHPFAQRPHRIPKASPTWAAIQAKRPFVQYDPGSDTSYFPPVQRALFVKLGVRALVWLPLVFGDDLIGVLAVRMSEERVIDDEELELAHELAQQVTVALEPSVPNRPSRLPLLLNGRSWRTSKLLSFPRRTGHLNKVSRHWRKIRI